MSTKTDRNGIDVIDDEIEFDDIFNVGQDVYLDFESVDELQTRLVTDYCNKLEAHLVNSNAALYQSLTEDEIRELEVA